MYGDYSFGNQIGLLGLVSLFGWAIVLPVILVMVLMLVSACIIFKKAGRSWWEALIPFYNLYVLTIIVGVPWWYLVGYFVPFLNWVVAIYMTYRLSKRFGFEILFTVGLILLPFIFYPILAFGGAVYGAPDTAQEEGDAVPDDVEVTPNEQQPPQNEGQTPSVQNA